MRKNDFAVWTHKVVVAFVHVRTKDLNMEKSLLDEVFHTLEIV